MKIAAQSTKLTQVRHKFKAQSVNDDGHHFASKLEHAYYCHLKLLQRANAVLFFLRQVPFSLPGGSKYVCDFQVFCMDGSVEFIEVKGLDTPTGKLKLKQVEELYPVKIKVVRKGDF